MFGAHLTSLERQAPRARSCLPCHAWLSAAISHPQLAISHPQPMSWSTSSCCACGCRAFERCARTASFDPMRAMPQWISETTQGPVCLPMSFVRYPLRRISETTQRLVIAPITHLIRGLSGHLRGVVALILLPVSPLACRRCVATGKATYKLKYYNMEEIRAAAAAPSLASPTSPPEIDGAPESEGENEAHQDSDPHDVGGEA